MLSVDLAASYTPTKAANTAILVLSDFFTRWWDAIAFPNGTKAVTVAVPEHQVFCSLVVPERIHTDRGLALLKQLCKLWGVAKSRSTLYHPQANGVVEEGNQDLEDAMGTMFLGEIMSGI